MSLKSICLYSAFQLLHIPFLFFQVCTEGRLILEFTFDDLMRIKTWHFSVRTHRELIPRSVVGMHSAQDPSLLEQLSKNITRQGITNSTLNYLRVGVKTSALNLTRGMSELIWIWLFSVMCDLRANAGADVET